MLEPQEEQRIYKEQYLSFVFDFEGWLGNQMVDYIETSLQELSVADLPLTLQSFDQPQSLEQHDQTYENTTLELISDFAYLLNQLDYEKY